MRVLVVNAGSSSLKLRLLRPTTTVARRSADLDATAAARPTERARRRVRELPRGRRASATASCTAATQFPRPVRRRRRGAARAARPDRPRAAAPAEVARGRSTRSAQLLPDLPAVACFDTAFHATLPPAAATYALPAAAGASARAAALRLPRALARVRRRGAPRAARAPTRSFASSPATSAPARRWRGADGRIVDTTMGFTPLEGLVMATRSGTVDPGPRPVAAARGRPLRRRGQRRTGAPVRAQGAGRDIRPAGPAHPG